jgi:hypothetical protein
MLIQTVYLALVVWGSVAAWKRGGMAKQVTMSVWGIVLYFWGITILTLSILRYMVPAMAFLCVLIPSIFCNRGEGCHSFDSTHVSSSTLTG